ncbi:isoprenoid biosynthesis glyoxalase ElbB [Ignatzschineria cameli]|uniref:Isoprenoid biosynthesis protein ElbB n=1 Tax=Ignatzschineria cameli TaxID=2182793 RepID=A0A2U2AU12_9GAMM|nr:isoprenoid biosynthesis glyoxalase ElbB [Ignatzschineria cameli]PWD88206.1 isoprenoid biosynthesis protein ElbB [Ignatzschineria cameli]PWD91235.1 isoprenoid biosynthesis protein ElbB [Ignatzschineria cameli]PWD92876.1 isoprenoid biosynthesis protein ElbB [Ignatzschineria cameli]PWD93897.1 isoprenoid biosynthesis protein ElbB [Ignatzschineria cameli]
MSKKHFALILSGCGHLDGAEITEATTLNIALSKAGIEVSFYAPDRLQTDTINHLNGEIEGDERNIMQEAARIARGKIAPIAKLDLDSVDGIALAGGFGVIKNFTNFIDKGEEATLSADIGEKLKKAIEMRKPIIAICAAPMAIAIALKELEIKDASITFGQAKNAGAFLPALKAWGITHIETATTDAHCDNNYPIITGGAYMDGEATPYEIYQGALATVDAYQKAGE